MPFVEFFLLRLALWGGLLVALLALAIGPRKLRRVTGGLWAMLWRKRLDPEEILTQVVRQHEQHVEAVRAAIRQAETAEATIRENLRQSQQRASTLDIEAKQAAGANDDLGARAALYKLNLEWLAIDNFTQQLEGQCKLIAESRHRLYLLELQLRQYEVGRTILVSQLAQAKTVEEQYAIARRFDPFNAVENWQKAESLVQEKSLTARAIERVYADTSDLSSPGASGSIDPTMLSAQLTELRAQLAAGDKAQPPATVPAQIVQENTPPAPPAGDSFNGSGPKPTAKERTS